MKYLLAILVILYLFAAFTLSEMWLIPYVVRCEVRHFVRVLVG